MIIDDPEISVFDVAKKVKKQNHFVSKGLKAYEFMSNDWYNYNIFNSFWQNIQECVEENLLNYTLWEFDQSFLEDTRINRFRGIAKDIIREGKRSGAYRGYVEMKDNELEYIPKPNQTIKHNETGLRFFTALECTHGGHINNCVDAWGYFLLLPKEIKEETIVIFLKKWKPITKTTDKKLLEINRDIYDFMIENKGALIESYSDASYYEYKGETSGYILIDPLGICPVERSAPSSAYKKNVPSHEKYDLLLS